MLTELLNERIASLPTEAILDGAPQFSRQKSAPARLDYRPRALRRSRPTLQQRHLSRPERLIAQAQSLIAASRQISGAQILLVDDVITTGGTLREGVRALYAARAASVTAVTMFQVISPRRRGKLILPSSLDKVA